MQDGDMAASPLLPVTDPRAGMHVQFMRTHFFHFFISSFSHIQAVFTTEQPSQYTCP